MNTKMTPPLPASDTTELWRQAVQGNSAARHSLLERIMSRRTSRPQAPRLRTYTEA
jgi:hypothetical protein